MTDTTQELPPPAPQPETAPRELKFKNSLPDWAIRAVFFLIFLYFGTAKFKSDADAPWVVLFNEIGLGQWLRYVTGAVEAVCAFMLLISGTVEIGLAILILTMICAIATTMLILHQFSGAFVPFALLCGMIAFWMHRRRV